MAYIPDKQLDPPDDEQPIALDFEDSELYDGDIVWMDTDGNYIDDDVVDSYFEQYLRFMGAERKELGE
ncbi:hypothetical protein JOC36_000839 [Weissella uvarum]|uniref:hypothetical protein n=1 Tax=Bacilli TaxID=91061 RepID=UPI0019600771|nr:MULTISPECIES: hypothetical protein [Bacilli]MBM7617290.1 hypothetical protein [Weissella uvarum]MCM0595207.1 hypothetical protein [Weissella uvarum]MDA5653786.1 hypothetical protein [Staphylococcus aureus]